MEIESASIVEQGNATAGDSSTANAVDTRDWYEIRKAEGADSAQKAFAVPGGEAEKTVPSTEPVPDTGKQPETPEKKTYTDAEKANHAWEAKFGKESGKRKQAEELATQAIHTAEQYRQRAEQLEVALKAFQEERIDRVDFPTEAEFLKTLSRRQAQEVMAQQELGQLHNGANASYAKAEEASVAAKAYDVQSRIPDWQETVSSATDIPMRPEVLAEIRKSDLMGEVAYYLRKNPEEALKLNSIPDLGTFQRVLARIEVKAEALYGPSAVKAPPAQAPAQPTVPVTQLKPTAPATSVGGAAPASAKTMSMDQYAQMRKKGLWPS